MKGLYLGLAHYPMKNKAGEKVCTSVTNLDIHDIARSCRTFGIKKYFIITPLVPQQQLVSRILEHWQKEKSSIYNPDRFDALSSVELRGSIDDALVAIEQECSSKPFLAITGAKWNGPTLAIEDIPLKIHVDNRPCLLLFGTGSGLHPEVHERADFKLASIHGAAEDGYNHLSVRSAVAIYLDRLSKNQERCQCK
ncbi:MAG: RNA methyltransferase [Bdellovibrio sp.]|nr:RNA methyltransferase [Bdellovibrio sp.]